MLVFLATTTNMITCLVNFSSCQVVELAEIRKALLEEVPSLPLPPPPPPLPPPQTAEEEREEEEALWMAGEVRCI